MMIGPDGRLPAHSHNALVAAAKKLRAMVTYPLRSIPSSAGLILDVDEDAAADSWIEVVLSGTASPYDWAEEVRPPGGPFAPRTGGRTGTGSAYEVNGIAGLGGKVVRLWPGAGPDDYLFQFRRVFTPCTATLQVVPRHCGTLDCLPGITIKLFDADHVQVGTDCVNTAEHCRGCTWTLVEGASYTIEFTSPLDGSDDPLYVGPTTKAIPTIAFTAKCGLNLFYTDLYDYHFSARVCVQAPCPGGGVDGVGLVATLVGTCEGTLDGSTTVDIDISGNACATFIGTNPIAGCAIQVTATPPGGKGFTACTYTTPTFDLNNCLASSVIAVLGCTLGLDDGLICECPACHEPIPATLFYSDMFGSCTLTYGPDPFVDGLMSWSGGYSFQCPGGVADVPPYRSCCEQDDNLFTDVIVTWYCGTLKKYAKICSLADCTTGQPHPPWLAASGGFEPNPVACGTADLDCATLPVVNQTIRLLAANCGRSFAFPCTEDSGATVTS